MSYNMKLENVLALQTYLNKITARRAYSIILYCPKCCLANCHYKWQPKNVFVFFVNWYHMLSS